MSDSIFPKGIDATAGTHADASCSYAAYVGEKFYAYVAMVEMIYVLANDPEARQQLLKRLEKGIVGNLLQGSVQAELGKAYAQQIAFESILNWFGVENKERINEYRSLQDQSFEKAHQHYLQASEQIKDACQEFYNEIKKRFTDCGFLYGVATLSTDGAFFVGELALAAGISAAAVKTMRSLKFAVKMESGGKFVVTATHKDGSLGSVTRTFEKEALEKKYGKPDDHHSGGSEKKANHEPSESGDAKKKKAENAHKAGALAEQQAKADLKKQGYDRVIELKNGSGNGPDLIGVNTKTGEMRFIEVKANGAGLSKLQQQGGPTYIRDQLQAIADGEGRYKSMSNADRNVARALLDNIDSGVGHKYEIWKYNVDPNAERVSSKYSANWDWKKGEKRKRLIFRDDEGRTGRQRFLNKLKNNPTSSSYSPN